MGIVVDRLKKNFSISREIIKSKAIETIPNATASDAYMYEGKEGVRISLKNGRNRIIARIWHIFWWTVDKDIENYVNWLLINVFDKHST